MTRKPYAAADHARVPGEGQAIFIGDEPRDLAILMLGGFLQTTGFPVFVPEEAMDGDAIEICDAAWAASQVAESGGEMVYVPLWNIGQVRDAVDPWWP